MTTEQVVFGFEARERVLRGVHMLADAIRVTLGPKSKCVLIEQPFGAPLVCTRLPCLSVANMTRLLPA